MYKRQVSHLRSSPSCLHFSSCCSSDLSTSAFCHSSALLFPVGISHPVVFLVLQPLFCVLIFVVTMFEVAVLGKLPSSDWYPCFQIIYLSLIHICVDCKWCWFTFCKSINDQVPLVLCSLETLCYSGALFLHLVWSHSSLSILFYQQSACRWPCFPQSVSYTHLDVYKRQSAH